MIPYITYALIALLGFLSLIRDSQLKEKKGKFFSISFLVIGILALLLTFVNDIKLQKEKEEDRKKKERQEDIDAKVGRISPIKRHTAPKLLVGRSYFILTDYAFCIPGLNKIEIYPSNKELFLRTVITGLNGKPIAVIHDTTWTLYSDEFEYNNDTHGFELVTKGERKVFFQAELIDDMVRIGGFVLNDEGNGIYMCEPEPDDARGSIIFVKVGGEKYGKQVLKNSKLVPIFNYPRETQLGVRNKMAKKITIDTSIVGFTISCPEFRKQIEASQDK